MQDIIVNRLKKNRNPRNLCVIRKDHQGHIPDGLLLFFYMIYQEKTQPRK